MAGETLLVLSGMGVPPYSARGLTQTLEPIDAAADVRRTINGAAVDLSESQFRKYRSTISCTDQQAPALEGIWPGQQLTVDCVFELSYETVTASPSRTEVPGSSYEESGFTFYRPRLTMMVTALSETKDEYGATTAWSLELEEV